jgi:hypothetical protein
MSWEPVIGETKFRSTFFCWYVNCSFVCRFETDFYLFWNHMKKSFFLLFMVLSAGILFTAAGHCHAEPKNSNEKGIKNGKTIIGKPMYVNDSYRVLIIIDAMEKETEFVVSTYAEILRDGLPIGLMELSAKNSVKVTYVKKKRKLVALRVEQVTKW